MLAQNPFEEVGDNRDILDDLEAPAQPFQTNKVSSKKSSHSKGSTASASGLTPSSSKQAPHLDSSTTSIDGDNTLVLTQSGSSHDVSRNDIDDLGLGGGLGGLGGGNGNIEYGTMILDNLYNPTKLTRSLTDRMSTLLLRPSWNEGRS